MIWSEQFRVNSHDADNNGVVRASPVLRYLQETANLQMHALGPSNEQLWDEGRAFILSKLSMCLYRPLHAYDKIEAQSWACASRGASFNRCGRIKRDGVIIAELSTVWALVNVADRSLTRVDDVTFNFGVSDKLELDAPARIKIPANLPLSLVGERAIVYSDLDRNNHMNNTNYPDMLCDHMPSMAGKRPVTVAMHFINESAEGEVIKIYSGEKDGVNYFRTVKKNGLPGVEAEIVFDDI